MGDDAPADAAIVYDLPHDYLSDPGAVLRHGDAGDATTMVCGAWLENDPAARTGWLGALQDAQIGRALALIHDDPQRPWTVAVLAAETAMSQSAFAARFTELVDEPAMRFVTRWRMQTALQTLKEADVTVAELARRYGYQSGAAFSRAFKRVVGMPPGSVRRMASTPLEVAG